MPEQPTSHTGETLYMNTTPDKEPAPPAPFFYRLNKVHKIEGYNIIKPNTAEAEELNTLLYSGKNDEYQKRLNELAEEGREFLSTEEGMREIAAGTREIEVRIAVQVKRYTITWYFWTKMEDQDLYSQEWRDQLYDAAAECHTHVERGCGLYYRGSDAFHLKTMHHHELEGKRNHNHYRMQENQAVRPEDFRQHMQAFKSAKHSEVPELFLSEKGRKVEQLLKAEELTDPTAPRIELEKEVDIIDELCTCFDAFYQNWEAPGPDGLSKRERYEAHASQKLSKEDILEFQIFGAQQEPCRLSVDELTVDYEAARKSIQKLMESSDVTDEQQEQAALELATVKKQYEALLAFREKGGSRGLGSDRAATRRVASSTHEASPLPAVVGLDAPIVPQWATTLKQKIEEAMQRFVGAPPIDPTDLDKDLDAATQRSVGIKLKVTAYPGTLFAPATKRDSPVTEREFNAGPPPIEGAENGVSDWPRESTSKTKEAAMDDGASSKNMTKEDDNDTVSNPSFGHG